MEINLLPLLPAAELALTALVILLLDLFLKPDEKPMLAWISILGCGIAAALTFFLWNTHESAFRNTFVLDKFALFFTGLFITAAILTTLSSIQYLKETGIRPGEFHALVLFATLGMVLMASANDLIVLFLGIETLSLAVYVLTGMWRERSQASEAAMKYFVVGSFATGFLLYGIALLFGAAGSTQLSNIAAFLSQVSPNGSPLATVGAYLLLIGLAFKVAAAPFHFWAPDVYEGAPTSVTAFMAVAVKASAFAAWGRVFLYQLAPISADWNPVVWALAILTMTVGNLLALAQTSVKRMLAFSSVAHAGYLLVGVVAGDEAGGAALLFYLLSYSAMSFGAFAVLLALKKGPEENEQYSHFAGLGFKRPFLALAMSVFMLSLAGFPPLGGFTGKFYIFRSAILAGHTELAVIAVLNSLLSVAYYLRVIVMMYMEEGGVEAKSFRNSPCLYLAILSALAGTLYLGLLPGPALELSRVSFLSLR
jgi:NADH-quinone oxidoreductase subunit N